METSNTLGHIQYNKSLGCVFIFTSWHFFMLIFFYMWRRLSLLSLYLVPATIPGTYRAQDWGGA